MMARNPYRPPTPDLTANPATEHTRVHEAVEDYFNSSEASFVAVDPAPLTTEALRLQDTMLASPTSSEHSMPTEYQQPECNTVMYIPQSPPPPYHPSAPSSSSWEHVEHPHIEHPRPTNPQGGSIISWLDEYNVVPFAEQPESPGPIFTQFLTASPISFLASSDSSPSIESSQMPPNEASSSLWDTAHQDLRTVSCLPSPASLSSWDPEEVYGWLHHCQAGVPCEECDVRPPLYQQQPAQVQAPPSIPRPPESTVGFAEGMDREFSRILKMEDMPLCGDEWSDEEDMKRELTAKEKWVLKRLRRKNRTDNW